MYTNSVALSMKYWSMMGYGSMLGEDKNESRYVCYITHPDNCIGQRTMYTLAVDVMSLSFNCDLGQKIVMGFMAMINDSKC